MTYPVKSNASKAANRKEGKCSSSSNFCEIFQRVTLLNPNAKAIHYYERSVTYAELDHLSDKVAFKLINSGVSPGDIVGVGMYNSIDLIVTMLGVMKSGGVYLPIEPNYSAKRIYLMSEGIEFLVINSNTQNLFVEMAATQIEINMDKLNDIKVALPKIESSQPAYIIYTSGTEGMPKGVVVSHGSLAYAANTFSSLFPSPPRTLMASSISFDPSILSIIHALGTGGSITLYKNDNNIDIFHRIHSLIRSFQINFIITTPSFYMQLLQIKKKLPYLKQIVLCGERIPEGLTQKHRAFAQQANLFNAYGPSEYAIGTTLGALYDAASRIEYYENIGAPFGENRLYVLDSNMEQVPIGEKGEFYVGGPGLSTGYYELNSLTKKKFIEYYIDGEKVKLYRTGDLGYQQENGNFVFCKRLNFDVKSKQDEIKKELNSSEATYFKKFNQSKRTTIVRRAPTYIGKEKHCFDFFAKVETKVHTFRESARDYIKKLDPDQSRRFTYTFDKASNHVEFQYQYALKVFKPTKESSTLLDIGCGPGLITKPLLPYYKSITGIDCESHLAPYLESLEKKQNFHYIFGKFQNTTIKGKFQHILCNHSIYYIPMSLWQLSLEKMLDLLEDGGSILIVQTAPLGPLHDLREPINPKYPHSGHMHELLEKMNIRYSTEAFVLQHPHPSKKAYRNLIHMYVMDGCYPPDGYSTSNEYKRLSQLEKNRLETLVEGFVSGCYDYTKDAYILHDVCHYIKIDKQ